jgi:hypothetical protein
MLKENFGRGKTLARLAALATLSRTATHCGRGGTKPAGFGG